MSSKSGGFGGFGFAAGLGRGLGATGAGAGAGAGAGEGAVEDGAGATGADESTGCTGTSVDGVEGTDAAGDGVGATRRARARRTGRARSDARTRSPGAAPSVTRSPLAESVAARVEPGCCPGALGAAAVGVPRSASATKPKEIVKIAAAMPMATSSAALSGRAALTTRGTSWASSDRVAGSDRCVSGRDGRG